MTRALLVVFLGIGLGCSGLMGGPAPEPVDGAPGVVLLEHELTDPGMQGAVAVRLLVPDGWSLEGGLQRPPPAAYRNPVLADVRVEAPDGRGVHFFPNLSFEEQPSQPQPPFSATPGGNFYQAMPRSIADWFMERVHEDPLPGITNPRLLSNRVIPETTAALQAQLAPQLQMMEQSNAMGAQFGVVQQMQAEAVELVLAYDQEGRALEETIHLAWVRTAVTTGGRLQSAFWGIESMVSVRGPAGTAYVDDPLVQAVVSSVRVDPQWAAEMQRYWTELGRIQHEGNMQRLRSSAAAQQKRSETLSSVGDILHEGFRARSAISDAGQARVVDSIHDRTTYATPTGGSVKLPSFYDQVYTDGDGRYLLHNDALHDPNTDPGFNARSWTRIEAAP